MTSEFDITEPTKVFVVERKETTSRWYEVMGVRTMSEAKTHIDEHGTYGYGEVAVAEVDGSWDLHKTHKATAVMTKSYAPCVFKDRWLASPPNKYGRSHHYGCSTVVQGTLTRAICRDCEERLEAGYTLVPKEDGEE